MSIKCTELKTSLGFDEGTHLCDASPPLSYRLSLSSQKVLLYSLLVTSSHPKAKALMISITMDSF